ncbi:hypothetical protein ABENE_17575 [Asticcacaulis benevestitus DSM 16100 = ATCC BAA-896]|uniref:Uncharacterized protein n=1 Tax=Asticcacaulis benevestitus DSM 16100 = ATCC BAA-896 TaxID=1121022 RepID=V4PII8_9CAUL|nr:hypothetical protein ABENE_17575 [Asticcacaulis benevestitus DSM 16100 = ATCC BAA-896]
MNETLSNFRKSGDFFHADFCRNGDDDFLANCEAVARTFVICRGITHQVAALNPDLGDVDLARSSHHLTGRNSPIVVTPRHLFGGGSKPPERTSTDAHLHEPRPFASMAKLGFFPPDGIFRSRRKTARHAVFRQFLAQQKSLT